MNLDPAFTRLLSARKVVTLLFVLVVTWMALGARDELRAMRCPSRTVAGVLTVRSGVFSASDVTVGRVEVCR